MFTKRVFLYIGIASVLSIFFQNCSSKTSDNYKDTERDQFSSQLEITTDNCEIDPFAVDCDPPDEVCEVDCEEEETSESHQPWTSNCNSIPNSGGTTYWFNSIEYDGEGNFTNAASSLNSRQNPPGQDATHTFTLNALIDAENSDEKCVYKPLGAGERGDGTEFTVSLAYCKEGNKLKVKHLSVAVGDEGSLSPAFCSLDIVR